MSTEGVTFLLVLACPDEFVQDVRRRADDSDATGTTGRPAADNRKPSSIPRSAGTRQAAKSREHYLLRSCQPVVSPVPAARGPARWPAAFNGARAIARARPLHPRQQTQQTYFWRAEPSFLGRADHLATAPGSVLVMATVYCVAHSSGCAWWRLVRVSITIHPKRRRRYWPSTLPGSWQPGVRRVWRSGCRNRIWI